MKKFEIVKLTNEKPYLKNNLEKNLHGISLEKGKETTKVLFFNPKNIGDYAVVEISNQDITEEKEQLPNELENEILLNLENILTNPKTQLEPSLIKEYAMVELLVEDSKYSKFGIHKGDTGCVMDNNAVNDYIEVDFSGIDANGEYYGDCISVKISDLKILKE